MTQPWEFMGYQKLTVDTINVGFDNLWDATSPAPKFNNMKFKMVAELLITDTADLLPSSGQGAYYNIVVDNTVSTVTNQRKLFFLRVHKYIVMATGFCLEG